MMGDYVERTLEAVKRLEAQLNSESGTTLDEYSEGSYQCRLFLPQLGETRKILEYELHKPTRLEGHRAVHRELHRAVMQIETSVKEWCIPGHHKDERALGKRREHCRETLLAARWWTMVTALQAGQRYYLLGTLLFKIAVSPAREKDSFHGDVPSMESKDESQVNSPISSYERQLPSVGFETWLQQWDQILQWEVEFGNILGKDASNANMALEAIRGADYRVVVVEDMPATYVDEAKSPLIEEEVTLDLTRDVLGLSRTGAWVIRTKCQGVDCALKRVTDGDNEPVLARLSHPHVVQLMHYWRKDEYMFLVMKLMEGDLTDLLSRHKRANGTLLSVSVAVDIMLQTAKGMLYLHDLGIAYPHLSCSNVLFRESGVSQDGGMQYIIKLGGFRICAWDASGGKEQDVYRFGLFCLEVLTGRQQCEDPLDMVADTRPSIPETVPQVLRFCISSCFESNVLLGFAQVVTLILLAQVQVLKSQENEVFLSFGTCGELDLVQLNQQHSESPSASGADLEKYPVHQLYPEPDVAGSDFSPSATLIFFHGFAKSSDEWKSTWMTRNREHVWPKAWLPKDLPGNVRILSLSYDIDAPGESQDIGAIEIGKDALRQLVLSSKWELADPKAKVILIGHSFGGLVIKSLVVEAHNLACIPGKAKTEEPLVMKCPSFLENLSGIVFYSVPGSGSQDQQFEQYIVKLNQTGVLQRSALMQALLKDTSLFNQQMISLCSQFEEIVPEKTQILGFIEGKGMRRVREKQVVVSDASARAQMKKAEFNIVEEDNHFEVCRPVSADHKGYKILVDFLKDKLKIGNPQDVPTGNQRLPPGFPFYPTDVEVVKVEPKSEMEITGGGNDVLYWPGVRFGNISGISKAGWIGPITANVDNQGQSSEGIRVFQRNKWKRSGEGSQLQWKSTAGAEAGDGDENNAENSESPGRETMSPETRRAALAGALKEIFARHHVCCMEIIVRSLQEMAIKRTVAKIDPEAAAVAVAAAEALNAPAVELIGAVNKVATRLGGVYILRSLGDPILDPFRDVVIGLLRKMGPHSGLRKTEIMSAFKIATGRDAPSTTYQKVMKELCYIRGAAWILKSGEG